MPLQPLVAQTTALLAVAVAIAFAVALVVAYQYGRRG